MQLTIGHSADSSTVDSRSGSKRETGTMHFYCVSWVHSILNVI